MQSTKHQVLGPPPIPTVTRVFRFTMRALPILVWLGLLVVVVLLHGNEPGPSHLLASASYQQAQVMIPIDARLAKLTVKLGDEVSVGDLIATLDTSDLDAQIRLAQSKLERTRNQINVVKEKLRLEFEDRKSQSASRQLSFEAERERRKVLIEQLIAMSASENAEIDGLSPQIERLRLLRKKQLTTVDRLEDLVQQRNVLKGAIQARQERIDSAKQGLVAWESMRPVDLYVPDNGLQLLPIQMQIEAQEARLKELELEKNKYKLFAPAAGRINGVFAGEGEWRTAGTSIVEILVPQPGFMTAYVSGRRMADIKVGDRVVFRQRQKNGPTKNGHVVLVGPRVDLVPEHLRVMATTLEWGRLVSIQIDEVDEQIPGETYAVRFE